MPGKDDRHIVDRIHQAKLKLSFLTEAIYQLWSDGTQWRYDVLTGCNLLMNSIADELGEVIEILDKEAPKKEVKNIEALKR